MCRNNANAAAVGERMAEAWLRAEFKKLAAEAAEYYDAHRYDDRDDEYDEWYEAHQRKSDALIEKAYGRGISRELVTRVFGDPAANRCDW